jgi:XTP/dITP diphosphohydrolase
MTVVLATTNKKKVEEIKRIFSGFKIRFLTLDSFPDCPEIIEDGKTFRANAIKKAVTIARNTGLPAIADDSGLEVKALGGAPGVFSARYAGKAADDQKNVRKLLREMKHLRHEDRKARFVCCIAFALPDGRCKTFTGYISGKIGNKRKGFNGFGYDPVFYPYGYDRTFAEMTGEEKDNLSHRGRALRRLYEYMRRNI